MFLNDENNDLLPLSGFPLMKTLMCNENGKLIKYYTDRYGFNNSNKIWDNENVDILMIGDSYTQGLCVENKFNMQSFLSSNNTIYQNLDVINLGMQGSGPLIEYAILKEYSKKINFKKIIWFYYEGNDLFDLQNELSHKILKRYYKNSYDQNLINRQSEINVFLDEYLLNRIKSYKDKGVEFSDFLKKFIFHLKLTKLRIELSELFNIKLSAIDKTSNKNIHKEFERVLLLFKKFSNDTNSELYFVYLPSYHRYKLNDDEIHDYSKVIKLIKKNNINLIDINMKLFKKIDDPLSLFPFRKFGHYSGEGYKMISNIILNNIHK